MGKYVNDQFTSSLSRKNASPVLLNAPTHTCARIIILVSHKELDEDPDLHQKWALFSAGENKQARTAAGRLASEWQCHLRARSLGTPRLTVQKPRENPHAVTSFPTKKVE